MYHILPVDAEEEPMFMTSFASLVPPTEPLLRVLFQLFFFNMNLASIPSVSGKQISSMKMASRGAHDLGEGQAATHHLLHDHM